MTEIRSFRRVFDLERRIYRVDRLRLNPAGIPVRGVVYFLVLLAASLLAAAAPLVSLLVDPLPWYARTLVLPALGSALLTAIRLEGRPFHIAAQALVRYGLGPCQLSGFEAGLALGARWRPGDLVVLPDGSDARMRRLRYTGPGAVLITVAHVRDDGAGAPAPFLRRWRLARRAVIVREAPDDARAARGEVIALSPRARLLTRA